MNVEPSPGGGADEPPPWVVTCRTIAGRGPFHRSGGSAPGRPGRSARRSTRIAGGDAHSVVVDGDELDRHAARARPALGTPRARCQPDLHLRPGVEYFTAFSIRLQTADTSSQRRRRRRSRRSRPARARHEPEATGARSRGRGRPLDRELLAPDWAPSWMCERSSSSSMILPNRSASLTRLRASWRTPSSSTSVSASRASTRRRASAAQ